MSCDWNELILNLFSSINWRASLVPAAAVIPAPIAYIKVVAVKKLVVGFLSQLLELPSVCFGQVATFLLWAFVRLISGKRTQDLYFEKIRVFQASVCFEYYSME